MFMMFVLILITIHLVKKVMFLRHIIKTMFKTIQIQHVIQLLY
jgi:hypothetical protein